MNIYFSGIGGVGIGALAQMALDAGHNVAGSDTAASLTTEELLAAGIQMTIGPQDGKYLRECHAAQAIDWFVYTAALPADHPELVAAQELGIHTSKRDGLLAKIIADSGQKLIAIAGTHGKTTTSGMLIWTLQQLGMPLSYNVGSQLSFGPAGRFDSTAQYFIYECDEFDRNFLHFSPYVSVIVSIDYDHPDTYPTEADYTAAFRQFISQSDHTLLWQQDADYIDLTPTSATTVLPAEQVQSLKLAGAHNRRNATLVSTLMELLSIGNSASHAKAVEQFPGTRRRFERLSKNIYSDYGHHPVEISATLQLAKEVADRVVLVYQPHQNIRQHEIRDQYTPDIFRYADEIYWLPTYLSREDPDLEILSPAQLTYQLTGNNLHIAEFGTQLREAILRHEAAGHLVLGMGAGSIDGWLRQEFTTPQN